VIGYEVITNTGSYCASAAILVSGLGFIASMISMYYHGMGMSGASNWSNMPILKWVRCNDKWEQRLSYGKYAEYQMDSAYTYQWMTPQQEMGFVQDAPPAECFVICSEGMRKAVDEIISTMPKETYN
jgi:hypothetical protein